MGSNPITPLGGVVPLLGTPVSIYGSLHGLLFGTPQCLSVDDHYIFMWDLDVFFIVHYTTNA